MRNDTEKTLHRIINFYSWLCTEVYAHLHSYESLPGNVSRRKVTVVTITCNGNVFLVEIMMKTSRVTNFTDYQDSLRLQRAHELVSISLLSSCVLSSCVFEVALTGCVTVTRDSKKKKKRLSPSFYQRKFYLCSRNARSINKIGRIVILSMTNNYSKIVSKLLTSQKFYLCSRNARSINKIGRISFQWRIIILKSKLTSQK